MVSRLVRRLALCALLPAFAFGSIATAGEPATPADPAFATPCVANASFVDPEAPELLDPATLEELPLTPAVADEKAVVCGSWIYNGCCITQTKYRRRCYFNTPAEWWYEYKCEGICHF